MDRTLEHKNIPCINVSVEITSGRPVAFVPPKHLYVATYKCDICGELLYANKFPEQFRRRADILQRMCQILDTNSSEVEVLGEVSEDWGDIMDQDRDIGDTKSCCTNQYYTHTAPGHVGLAHFVGYTRVQRKDPMM